MAQLKTPTARHLVPSVDTGTTLTVDYNSFIDAFVSNNSGQGAPAYKVAGTIWADTQSHQMKAFIGGSWKTLVHMEMVGAHPTISTQLLPTATTNDAGIVLLSSSTSSTSTRMAATPSAVKVTYDLALQARNAANAKADVHHTHTANDITGGTFNEARIPFAVPASSRTAAKKGAIKLVWDNTNKILDIRTS